MSQLLMKIAAGAIALIAGIVLAYFSVQGDAEAATAWKPDKSIEIIVPSAAGSGSDGNARRIQQILMEYRLVSVPVSVVNKPGGGAQLLKLMETDYAQTRALFLSLGLVK